MSDESISDKLKKPVNNKALGAMYIFISFLILIVGYIAHITNTLMINPQITYETLLVRMDLYFLENVFIGFFIGIFLILGMVYLKKKPVENNEG